LTSSDYPNDSKEISGSYQQTEQKEGEYFSSHLKVSKIPNLTVSWLQPYQKNRVSVTDIQLVEDDTSSISSSSGPNLPRSSPNTSLQAPSRGSDHNSEISSTGSFFQNPENVRVNGGQFSSTLGHHVTINLPREFVLSDPLILW